MVYDHYVVRGEIPQNLKQCARETGVVSGLFLFWRRGRFATATCSWASSHDNEAGEDYGYWIDAGPLGFGFQERFKILALLSSQEDPIIFVALRTDYWCDSFHER
jgi:hypothetical protein